MKKNIIVNGSTIPEHELEITASRAGGPGGQHVNKASTRVSVRWNVRNTTALTPEQKERIIQKLASRLTTDGDIIIHASQSRSQLHNKETALRELEKTIKKALIVPKKRLQTRASESAQEKRLETKSHRSAIKKMRSKKFFDE